MSNLIQAYPGGIQSLLGIKGGDLPKLLTEGVSPVLDWTQYYLLTKQEYAFTGTVAAVVGFGNSYAADPAGSVPQGEAWYVWQYQVGASTGVGTALDLAPAVQYAAALGANQVVGNYQSAPASSHVIARADTPFIIPPGSILKFACRAVTGAVNVSATYVITRIKV